MTAPSRAADAPPSAPAVRAALDTVVGELARWSLAAAGIATGMRAEAARYAAVDQAAIPATEDL